MKRLIWEDFFVAIFGTRTRLAPPRYLSFKTLNLILFVYEHYYTKLSFRQQQVIRAKNPRCCARGISS